MMVMRRIRLTGGPLKSTDRFRATAIRCVAALTLASFVALDENVAAAQESPATVTLATLEARIPLAPGVLADRSAIDETIEDVRAKRDETGLRYSFTNAVGPAQLIVTGKQDNFVVRYEQIFGLSLPLVGTKIAQQLAVLSAREREQLAVIAFDEIGRQHVAQLRNAYVQYWSFLNRAHVAQTYLELSRDERKQAEVLRRAGFTTSTDLLDFLNAVQKVRSESEGLRSSARGQLALIAAAVGSEVPSFQAVEPLFFHNCSPERSRAIESAYRVDSALARYDATAVEVREQLARVRGSTIDASAHGGAGSVTDINHRVSGYSLKLGVDLAFSTHARDEERALRAQYADELKTLKLRTTQRRVEIASAVDSDLDDIDGSRFALRQTLADRDSIEADLRNAVIRFNTLRQASDVGFNDVRGRRSELYVAQRSAAEANATLLLKANDLLAIAPDACAAEPERRPIAPTPTPSAAAPLGKTSG